MFLWIKAFHIIFVISWFAGIFYLPRLFVHHAMSNDNATQERLSIMEQKLYKFVTPIAFISIGLGLWMVSFNPSYYLHATWFHIKASLVLILLAYHFYCGYLVAIFAKKQNTRSHVFYRIFNELPVFLLAIIVIMAVVKPL